jgi:hypothetical protein
LPDWRNRIVGYGEASPASLPDHPLNWRKHPAFQARALTGVLEEVGWVQNVIVNKRTGHLVDGHLRVALARQAGHANVPVTYVDLSEPEERLVLATLDPLSALADADAPALDALLREVNSGSEALQGMLAGLARSAGLFREEYRFMGDESQPDDGASEQATTTEVMQFPLAIVLSLQEYYAWQRVKKELGARSDKEALLLLLPAEGEETA